MNPKILGWSKQERMELRIARSRQRRGKTLYADEEEIVRRYWRELKRRKRELAPDARINREYRAWCEAGDLDPKSPRNWRAFVREGRQ